MVANNDNNKRHKFVSVFDSLLNTGLYGDTPLKCSNQIGSGYFVTVKKVK